ncbi:MAG: response regulator transcription factor [Saprospiraceae bacterium]|nr:response regulator transcription factor [Candidatus Opimibacter skivensis]MBL0008711.1 response regulator transcription factor [Candidatus Opimibacter skivensis]
MLNTVLIEDSDDAAEKLTFLLTRYCADKINLLKLASSGAEGIEAIRTHRPELVFLDIELGDMTAFEMLERIDPVDFQVIFTTSFDHYAIKAIRYSAVDYLQKPVGREELLAAIQRAENNPMRLAREQINQMTQQVHAKTQLPDKIALTTADGLVFKKIADIIRCESERMYTNVIMSNHEKIVVSKPMGQLEDILHVHDFFRVHNSHLINMRHIRQFVRTDGGYVVMEDGASVSVARNRKEDFLDMFSRF